VIYASLPDPKSHPRHNINFPRSGGIPHLSDFEIQRRWEGQVSPNVPQYVLWRETKRQLLDVRIWFGTRHPPLATRNVVGRELKTLSIPPYRPAPRTPRGRCPRDPSQGTYQPLVSTNAATPGSSFDVWGGMPTRAESGRYDGPTERVEFWWNLDLHSYWETFGTGRPPSPATSGPVGLLGTRDRSDHCNYQLALTVPRVPSGTYSITGLELGGGGGTNFPPMTFHVTAPGS
jgi:hypothetical protein